MCFKNSFINTVNYLIKAQNVYLISGVQAGAFGILRRLKYRVSQKFVPLLYKSVFQYDWTW